MSNPPWIKLSSADGVYALRDAENSLLQVLLTEFHLSRTASGFLLGISFDERTPTIRRREGKRRVKRQMPGYPAKVERIQEQIDDVLFRNRDSFPFSDPEFAFRYASGGTLPIVKLDNRTYYCLFYRDEFPVGWNIANGACDSLAELLNPKLAIERELREEVIVLGLDHSPPHDFEFTWAGEEPTRVPDYRRARTLASRFFADELVITKDFLRAPLAVKWDALGPDTVQITYAGSDPKVQQGYYLNINAEDFGIEFDRVGMFEMQPNMVLLDGEINNHRLLNRPVGLFEVCKTQNAARASQPHIFTARDVVSRWDVIQAQTRATAQAAAQFLDTLQHRMPFPIRALQVDGGSEFAAEFEQACQQRGLHLFVLPPRSPKLNGAVERANRTHTEEFYPVTPCSLEMKALNRELRQWEKIYNTVRPHQSLGYLTPQQFLLPTSSQRKE